MKEAKDFNATWQKLQKQACELHTMTNVPTPSVPCLQKVLWRMQQGQPLQGQVIAEATGKLTAQDSK